MNGIEPRKPKKQGYWDADGPTPNGLPQWKLWVVIFALLPFFLIRFSF